MTRILINWRFRFLRIYKKTRWNLHSNFSYHISSHNINGKRFCAVAKKKRLKAIILTSLEMTSDFTFLFVFMSQYYCFCNVTEWHIFFSGKPISWALLNPSVSPFKVSANGMVVESSNPAVRLYRYNTFTGEVCLFLYTLYRYFMCTFFSTKNIRPYTLFRNWKFMLDETAKFEILENKKIFFILCNFGFVTLMLWFMLIAHAAVANPKWKKR